MDIVVDFDGTIVYDKYPKIGKLKPNAKKVLKKLHWEHTLILNTCREGIDLHKAEQFLKKQGIYFDFVNMHTIQKMQYYGNDPRKVSGDIVIDDKNLGGIPDDWEDIYKLIEEHHNV